MKKRLLIILIFVLITTLNQTVLSAEFRLDYSVKETEFVQGIRHTRMVTDITYEGQTKPQIINYMAANPTQYDNIHVVTGDNYHNYGWGKGTIDVMAKNINNTHENLLTIGGVNGDFFGASGITIEAYIHNYEILNQGLGHNRSVIGFKDDGTAVFNRPCLEGYELIVFNENNNIKNRVPIGGINRLPQSEDEITVYFDNINGIVTEDINKVVIAATDIKIDDWDSIYFGKGNFDYQTKEPVEIDDHQLIITGIDFNNDSLITDNDRVVIQQRFGCGFEDVRYAIGGWEVLVTDGVATDYYAEGAGPTYRHPRTALGIKEDGTVFFVTIDGRDYVNGYLGVTAYELAEIMLYFDAEHAFNLDGGGSTAMILLNEETDEYDYLNTPSDGQPRSSGNGIFFAVGTQSPSPEQLPWPDTRTILDTPIITNITDDHTIYFTEIPNASGYEVIINDVLYEIEEPMITLPYDVGSYTITIQAKGDTSDYKDSVVSIPYTHILISDSIADLLELFRQTSP